MEQTVNFPPYGLINEDYANRLVTRPLVPPDWEVNPGCDAACREAEWLRFRQDVLNLISEVLWPVFDQVKQQWVGLAVRQMEQLTRKDLEILRRWHTAPVRPLDDRPETPVRTLDCPAHRQFFLAEDDLRRALVDMYNFYDRTLDDKLTGIFDDVNGDGLGKKVSTASLQFKLALQRPRPYQCAYMMQINGLVNEFAAKSMTPSMSSGHSLQGVLGVATIMERIITERIPFSPDSWIALEQHAVDLGDRRVFAGVHFPSDNLASWIIALQMAPKVYSTTEVGKRLWSAISTRSRVYRTIVAASKEAGGEVYQDSLRVLEELGRRF